MVPLLKHALILKHLKGIGRLLYQISSGGDSSLADLLHLRILLLLGLDWDVLVFVVVSVEDLHGLRMLKLATSRSLNLKFKTNLSSTLTFNYYFKHGRL